MIASQPQVISTSVKRSLDGGQTGLDPALDLQITRFGLVVIRFVV